MRTECTTILFQTDDDDVKVEAKTLDQINSCKMIDEQPVNYSDKIMYDAKTKKS